MPSSLLASLLAVAAAMALLAPSCVAFVPGPPSSKRAASTVLAKGIKTNEDREVDANNAFQKTWNGGAFAEDPEANLAAAAGIASRIRSVGDLGWTSPPRRRGATRPRHRAWGGTGEAPIQLKPNYDEANPNCPEKWLAVEEFYSLSKDSTAGKKKGSLFYSRCFGEVMPRFSIQLAGNLLCIYLIVFKTQPPIRSSSLSRGGGGRPGGG